MLSQNMTIPTKNGAISAIAFDAQNNASNDDTSPDENCALVLLHDVHGLDEATQQAAAHLADLGYAVVAPDLFAYNPPVAVEGKELDEAALLDYASTLSDSRAVEEALAAIEMLAQNNDSSTRIGVVGFGWGGAIALMAASHDSRVRVAANIGGTISYPVLSPQRPGSPLNFVANLEGALFAAFAGHDACTPHNEIERLRARLVEHDKKGEVKTYDATARFWRDEQNPATRALWLRLENFLNDYLREDPEAAFTAPQELPEDGYPNDASRLHA